MRTYARTSTHAPTREQASDPDLPWQCNPTRTHVAHARTGTHVRHRRADGWPVDSRNKRLGEVEERVEEALVVLHDEVMQRRRPHGAAHMTRRTPEIINGGCQSPKLQRSASLARHPATEAAEKKCVAHSPDGWQYLARIRAQPRRQRGQVIVRHTHPHLRRRRCLYSNTTTHRRMAERSTPAQ